MTESGGGLLRAGRKIERLSFHLSAGTVAAVQHKTSTFGIKDEPHASSN
jgi:hypothetical protein